MDIPGLITSILFAVLVIISEYLGWSDSEINAITQIPLLFLKPCPAQPPPPTSADQATQKSE